MAAGPRVLAGIDVSANSLSVAMERQGELTEHEFNNDRAGHDELLKELRKGHRGSYRVTLEATGIYHLDLALRLAKEKRAQVAVANPMATHNFARALMERAKTDRVDAKMLLEFTKRMKFKPWTPPSRTWLELRAVTRHLSTLISQRTAVINRLKAAKATSSTPAFLIRELRGQRQDLTNRIERAEAEALRILKKDPELVEMLASMKTAPGIADRSAVVLLGELCFLDPTMTPKQVVAHAGLDPRPKKSGVVQTEAKKISKQGNPHIRGALFMPAMTTARASPAIRAWKKKLEGKGKHAFTIRVAVMRRLLRVLWVLMTRRTSWEEDRVRPRFTSEKDGLAA